MLSRIIIILNEPIVRDALSEAWQDSQPGPSSGHEEGGFILRNGAGEVRVIRWPTGGRDSISTPPHVGCRIEDNEIIATFHTHPNTGADYLQEPGEADRRGVRDDPDLKGVGYVGEFVISQRAIYLIAPDGIVREVAATAEIILSRRP